jgi:hypothetical protein
LLEFIVKNGGTVKEWRVGEMLQKEKERKLEKALKIK